MTLFATVAQVTSSKNLVPCKAVSSVRYLLGGDLPSERRKPRLKAPPPPPPPLPPPTPPQAPASPPLVVVEEDAFAFESASHDDDDATEILRLLEGDDAPAVRAPVTRGMDDLIPSATEADQQQLRKEGVEPPSQTLEPQQQPGKYCLRPRSSSRRHVVLLSDEDDEDGGDGVTSPEAHVAVAVGRRRRGEAAAGRRPRKGRPQPLSKYRRRTANARERQRMREINAAFETLRRIVPVQKGADPAVGGGCVGGDDCEKMTKITTLRLAMRYITALTQALAQSKSAL